LPHKVLEEKPTEKERKHGAKENTAHHDWNGENQSFDLAVEHLGVSEAEHDVVEGDWQSEHQADRVEEVYGSNRFERVQSNPLDEFSKHLADLLEIQNAKQNNDGDHAQVEHLW